MVTNLYQVATYHHLKVGAYDGTYSVRGLTNHGDFGLGTFNGLDGELVMVDGTVHRIDGFGDASVPNPTVKSPFAFVTRFRPAEIFDIHSPLSPGMIEATVDQAYPTGMVAIRLTGRFHNVVGRSFAPQLSPYRPFLSILDRQSILPYGEVDGDFVGFRMPKDVAKGDLNVPGYHFHFVDRSRRRGGHVLSYAMRWGTIQVMPLGRIVPLRSTDRPALPTRRR